MFMMPITFTACTQKRSQSLFAIYGKTIIICIVMNSVCIALVPPYCEIIIIVNGML